MASDDSPAAQIARDAELVYNYHRMGMALRPADAIFCLCSLDLRVAERAAQLLLDGLAGPDGLLIFSGGSGKLTEGRFAGQPEADVFAAVARRMGVPDSRILVEPRSANTGENVRFTRELLRDRGLSPRSFVLVQKPYMERRTYATFCKQWLPTASASESNEQQQQPEFTVTSPQMSFGEYPDADNPRDLVINIMVGDLVRIRTYPALGFQIPQDIPADVWEAGQRLIAAGFDGHLP
ncbi:hypothetical protein MAPG_04119 [Magnaporthiopsis poae ATCC 64411]|uniref:DUF218 domain-containing protein n=1 Tax=Magnaporthiopsis poae (strain ATCC 64411 / 73-15) TaxID=644358 RepID=A0A0C4DVV6_MAGP6|nr:hypothetical protein MAPG_04119 [Magnaporthiopsis poae ATCC 64411]